MILSNEALKPANQENPLRHVAIIMDGNRRWAKSRGMPPFFGHRKGAESVRRSVETAVELGIPYLTLFAFSSENWRRPQAEVSELMELLRLYLKKELRTMMKNGVRLHFIGDRSGLSPDIVALIDETRDATRANVRLTLTLALNYGARNEILHAARALAASVKNGERNPDDIDEDAFASALYTDGMPDPDLLIRTSGEQRISNFLLWQLAYTELVFLPISWPEFTAEHFRMAVTEFSGRDRRYGACTL